jgi:hypothetical protein
VKFKVDIVGLKELHAKVAGIRGRLKDMGPASLRAGMVVLAASREHIKGQGGGSWAPTVETERGAPLFRTGRLINSLTIGAEGNVARIEDGGSAIVVGTNLATKGGLSIGRMMQEGTGIYGPTGSPIVPKSKTFLMFVVNGQRIFTKSVKGSPKRPFLWIDDHIAGAVRTVYGNWIMRGPETV